MTVYVDDMRAPLGRLILCHMIADTDGELHDMADAIGLDRKWFQGDHYDVIPTLRWRAQRAGAIGITRRQAGAMMALRRRGEVMGAPETAVERFGALLRGRSHAGRNRPNMGDAES